MSGRRSSALPAALAAAGVLLAAGAWFLRGEGEPAILRGPGPGSGATTPEGTRAPTRDPAAADRPETLESPAEPPPSDGDATGRAGALGSWDLPPLPPAREAWAHLRFLDAATGEPVAASARPAVILVARTDRGILRLPQRLYADGDGRAAVVDLGATGGRPGENLFFSKEEEAAIRYEVLAFGYAPLGDLARADLEGEHDLRLARLPPAVRGVLEAGPGLGRGIVRCELLRAGEASGSGESFFTPPDPGMRVPALPCEFGTFTIPSLPAGRWTLVVRHQQAGGVQARAEAIFEVGAETVDLGTLVVHAPATLRARVIGADGTGMLDRGLRVRKVGGAAGDSSPVGEPDLEGWVEFRGLEPDADYEILCSFEGLGEVVHTPADGGTPIIVELRSEIRGVRCRIRFTVKGEEPLQWGIIVSGPTLDANAWKKDGLLEQEMAPGDYSFAILAQPAGSETMARYYAKFTVPASRGPPQPATLGG